LAQVMIKVLSLSESARLNPSIPARVAAWEFNAFGGRTVAERLAELENLTDAGGQSSCSGRLQALVAVDLETCEPLGSAALTADALAWRKKEHDITPWVTSIFVQKPARKRGVGRNLIEAIGREAVRRGFGSLFIETDPVDDVIKAAFGLQPSRVYQSWGFVVTNLHRRFCRSVRGTPDFVIMQKCDLDGYVPPLPPVAPPPAVNLSSKPGSPVVLRLQDAVASRPELIVAIATWEARAFGGRTMEERLPSMTAVVSGCKDVSPHSYLSVLVAFENDTSELPLGSVCLVTDDLAWRQIDHGLAPWLANLFVPRHARGKGIAHILTDCVVAEALRLGYEKVFLYLDPSDKKLIAMYQRWSFEEMRLDRRLVGGQSWKHGVPLISVMQRSLLQKQSEHVVEK